MNVAAPHWFETAGALVRRRPAASAALVAALAFLNTLPNEPVLDDGWAVLDNPLVRSFDLAQTFRAEYGAGGATVAGVYRPVATLTWALQYAVHGRMPAGYHLVNVLLHAAATALVVLLARRVVAAVAPERAAASALGAGLLFAVHPAHVEAVAPLVARADLLAAVAGLGALLLALSPRPAWRWPAAFALLAAGVLGKETAAVVPVLYLLVAVTVPAAAGLEPRPGLPGSRWTRPLQAGAVAAFLALAVLVTLLLRPRLGIPVEARWFGAQPPSVVWNTMTRALAEYLRILVAPASLSTDFGYAARIPFTYRFGLESALATAAWGAVLAVGVASVRRRPLVALGILWVFAGLSPVLNVLPTGVLMAERLLYLASVGPCILAADLAVTALGRLHGPAARRAGVAGCALALALLAGRAVARNAEWRTPESLFEAELRTAPLDPVVNNNLAVAYTGRGEAKLALERLEVALTAAPSYWRAHVNKALALEQLGDWQGALGALSRASELAPGIAAPHFYTGLLLARRGESEHALSELSLAEGLAPADARTVLQVGKVLADLGRVPEARKKLRRAAALDPKDPEAARLLARLEGR